MDTVDGRGLGASDIEIDMDTGIAGEGGAGVDAGDGIAAVVALDTDMIVDEERVDTRRDLGTSGESLVRGRGSSGVSLGRGDSLLGTGDSLGRGDS